MADIQQRIADAIQKQADLNMDCDRDIDEDPHDHWLDLAAAVVCELGLTQEWRVEAQIGGVAVKSLPKPYPPDKGKGKASHRFVTEWVPDE